MNLLASKMLHLHSLEFCQNELELREDRQARTRVLAKETRMCDACCAKPRGLLPTRSTRIRRRCFIESPPEPAAPRPSSLSHDTKL